MTFLFADHGGDSELPKWRLYSLGLLTPSVTVADAVASGSQTVTPPSMERITVGTKLTVMDFDAPSLGRIPAAALAGVGAGSVDAGAHSYKVVVNRGGGIYTAPSAASQPVTVASPGTNGKVEIDVTVSGPATPPPLPTGYTWDIYRTKAGADPTVLANFFLVNPSPLTATTLDYLDNIADSALGATAPIASNGGTHDEIVTVTAITLTTFTATFAYDHYVNWLLGVPAPFYWTDHVEYDIETDDSMACGAHRWKAMPIEPGPVNTQPTGASASFQIADANNTLFPVLKACNGGERAFAAIYEAGFSPTNKTPIPDDVVEVFSGRVDRSSFDSSNVDLCEIVLMQDTMTASAMLPTRLISGLVRTAV